MRRVAKGAGPGARRYARALCLLALGACDGAQSALDSGGPAAARIEAVWWVLAAGAAGIFVFVGALFFLAVARSRGVRPADPRSRHGTDEGGARAAPWILLGAAATALVVVVLFVYALRETAALDPRREPADIVIAVDGRRWWWDVAYLEGGDTLARTANEIHVPVGARVELRLTSADVIHSFWVPGLAGKMDMIPGRANVTWLRADRPGTFRGQCAEYCGLQHARMAFLVIATPRPEYDAWLARQRAEAPPPAGPEVSRGFEVFRSHCSRCHAVRGTPAVSRRGPDLTRLAGRRTLGAGTLANTPANLAGWVLNAQHAKPGSLMPPISLEPAELRDLLAYLATLR